MKLTYLIILTFLVTVSDLLFAQVVSPYIGQEMRSIKALSDPEIEGYLKGHGMGMAKAGELNHYPGPKHVLDLSDSLDLSEKQIEQTEKNYQTMKTKVVLLGSQYVEKEKILDAKFANEDISHSELQSLIEEISDIQGKIRLAHLGAHLIQKRILTPRQVIRYDKLRGYHNTETPHKHRMH